MIGTFRILISDAFSRPRLRWILLGFAGVSIVFSAVVIIWNVSKPSPPDPDKAEIKTAVEFAKSQQFLDMNSKERGRYVDSLAKRYAAMNPREQAEAVKAFRYLRRENPREVKVFWLSFVNKKAEEYHDIPPDQKQQYVDNLINKMMVLSGGSKRMKERLNRHHSRQNSKSGKKFVQRSRRNARLLLEKSTAEERAKISRAAGDIIQRLRQRHGEE